VKDSTKQGLIDALTEIEQGLAKAYTEAVERAEKQIPVLEGVGSLAARHAYESGSLQSACEFASIQIRAVIAAYLTAKPGTPRRGRR
jgi:hypothetical protein